MTNHSTTIWHIDDDELLLTIFEFVLQEAGFNVVSANGKAEILKLAAAAKPDLVLLDMDMPAMSGLDVLQLFGSLPGLEDVLVVVVSSRFASDPLIHAAFEAGVAGYISKARLDLESLPGMVRDYLQNEQKVKVS
jgi:CheY-like chemotaxis protein